MAENCISSITCKEYKVETKPSQPKSKTGETSKNCETNQTGLIIYGGERVVSKPPLELSKIIEETRRISDLKKSVHMLVYKNLFSRPSVVINLSELGVLIKKETTAGARKEKWR